MGAAKQKAKAGAGKWGHHAAITAAAFTAEILALAALYLNPLLGTLWQWLFALVSIIAVGVLIKSANALQGWGFLYLVGSRRGLASIDSLSRRWGWFWNELSVWGLVLGFGLLSYPLFRKQINPRQYAFGIASLVAIMFFVLPLIAYAVPFINIPQLQAAAQGGAGPQGTSYLPLVFGAISLVGGFAAYVLLALLYNAGSIVYGIAGFVISVSGGRPQPSLLTQSLPGVAPIIPGIDIPLVAGIIALALLLVVHETSHGLLARRAKVRLKSIGLLVMGVIPVGAFVEPDDRQVARLSGEKQTKIFSAGISANFLAMVVFALLMALFLYFVLPGILSPARVIVTGTLKGYPAYGAIPVGAQVLSWNGRNISTLQDFRGAANSEQPNSMVRIVTSNGTFTLKAVAANSTRGVVGVEVGEVQGLRRGSYPSFAYFLYTLFALSFMLNFLVAVVNLLPLPGFDGWRIYQTNVRSRKVLKVLTAIVAISLLINVFQWVFYI